MKPIEISFTDYKEMVSLFHDESDRGAAVLAGSYVENYLGLFLRSCMIDASLSDRIFDSNGPLASFSQRIDFAQAFGFLPKPLCNELHLLRKIRNHFAHHPKSASFNQSPVREWISLLLSSVKVSLNDGKLFQLDDPKTAFLVSAGMFVIHANTKIHGLGNPEV